MTRYDHKGNAETAPDLVQCAEWVQSLTGDRYPNLDNGSDSTTFEVDIPSELLSISRAGDNSRLLLSIIHSAANNLLSEEQASETLTVILQNSNRKIFQALIAGQSPATKAIARTFLPAAIDSLDCSLVSTLLNTGINPNSCMGEGRRRPLQIAIHKQSMDMMQLLLDRGADVNTHLVALGDGGPATNLQASIITGRLDLVQLLLRAGAHVNDPSTTRMTSPLYTAAGTGRLGLVQLLLEAGADINWPSRGAHRITALSKAAGSGNAAIVQLLLSHGADVNAPREAFRRTALEEAVLDGNTEIVQLLMEHGATDIVSTLKSAGKNRRSIVNSMIRFGMESHTNLNVAFGRTALQAATRCGDFELVQSLLSCGANANTPAFNGDTCLATALQIAASNDDFRLVELLIYHGADINAPAHRCSATTLQKAVRRNNMRLVQVLLSLGADINAPSKNGGRTALAEAANQGNLDMLQLLLDSGADMSTQGGSAVIEAVGHVPLEHLRRLLEAWTFAKCGNLNWEVNQSGKTALEIAASTADIELIRLLLQYEASNSSLALRMVILINAENIGVVKLLLASGAEVGYLDCDSKFENKRLTALGCAALIGCVDILRLLLEHWIGPTANELSGALQHAAGCSNLDAARLLLDYGADINSAPLVDLNDGRRTALQAAAGNGDLEVVRFLLEAGADVESRVPSEDELGTALQFAAIAGSMSVVTLLIEKGADVSAPAMREYGRTALEGAAEHGRLDIVQLLLNHGAEVASSRAILFARKEGHDGVVDLLEEA